MSIILLKNGTIINEDISFKGSILINGEIIQKIISYSPEKINLSTISDSNSDFAAATIIDCEGLLIFPGLIDDQVHFREPGSTHKGCIESESKAAVLGGVTSFMDMPNNNPPITSNLLLENKYRIAQEKSFANYTFYIGADNSNIDELSKVDRKNVCGIKVFMGSSTGNMLVDNIDSLNKIFSINNFTIATHCEEEKIIKVNLESAKIKYGDQIPFASHSTIRSREACIASTKKAIDLAIKHNTKLHILHISTKEEVELIREAKKMNPNISAETCVHYLFLNSGDYEIFGGKIKCNPSIKDESDRLAIINGVLEGVIEVIATDHAPHTIEEKSGNYLSCPSGLPLVQHSLQIMMELCKDGFFTYEELVRKMCHAPAKVFGIEQRGYIKEGYYADITVIDPLRADVLTTKKPSYLCGWSPFENLVFSSSVLHTFVNGVQVVENGKLTGRKNSKRLKFNYEF